MADHGLRSIHDVSWSLRHTATEHIEGQDRCPMILTTQPYPTFDATLVTAQHS